MQVQPLYVNIAPQKPLKAMNIFRLLGGALGALAGLFVIKWGEVGFFLFSLISGTDKPFSVEAQGGMRMLDAIEPLLALGFGGLGGWLGARVGGLLEGANPSPTQVAALGLGFILAAWFFISWLPV